MLHRLVWVLLLVPVCAFSHDLRYSVTEEQAVVIRVHYPDGRGLGFEQYEISPLGETGPVQTGRTDARGQIAFLPPGPGQWRVTAFSADGHGVEFTLTTKNGRAAEAKVPIFDRYPRLITGLGLILGLFGLVMLFVRRRTGGAAQEPR
jgi:nickel transport protein